MIRQVRSLGGGTVSDSAGNLAAKVNVFFRLLLLIKEARDLSQKAMGKISSFRSGGTVTASVPQEIIRSASNWNVRAKRETIEGMDSRDDSTLMTTLDRYAISRNTQIPYPACFTLDEYSGGYAMAMGGNAD